MSPQERAAKAIELLQSRKQGMLCTHSERMPGFPYGSFAPYAVGARNEPFFFLSGLAAHTKNLRHSAKASLLVGDDDPAGARANLFGEIVPVGEEAEVAGMRTIYLARHPDARQWIEFGDFGFHRMRIANVYWVGGFGEMGWIPAGAFAG